MSSDVRVCGAGWHVVKVNRRGGLHPKHGLRIEGSLLFGFFPLSASKRFEGIFLPVISPPPFLNVDIYVHSQDDLSVPLGQENVDGSSGVLFPFYDPDTHMLYIAGKVGL